MGEATETALIVLGEKLNPYNISKQGLDRRGAAIAARQDMETKWKKVSVSSNFFYSMLYILPNCIFGVPQEFTLEFSRDRKSMSSYCTPLKASRLGNGPKMFIKGAPEGVLDRCTHVRVGTQKVPMTAACKQKILDLTRQYGTGRDTLRCLGLCTIDNPTKPEDMELADSTKFHLYEVNMTFVGVVGMLDPPRKEVKDAIRRCRDAGIRVIVITGDNKVCICLKPSLFKMKLVITMYVFSIAGNS